MSKIPLHRFLAQFAKDAAIGNLAAVETYLLFAQQENKGQAFEVPLANGQKGKVDPISLLPDKIPLYKELTVETEIDFSPIKQEDIEEDASYILSHLDVSLSKGLFKRYGTVKVKATIGFTDTTEALQILKDRSNAITHHLANRIQPQSETNEDKEQE